MVHPVPLAYHNYSAGVLRVPLQILYHVLSTPTPMQRIIEDLGSAIVVESPPSMQGRTMNMILGPRKDV